MSKKLILLDMGHDSTTKGKMSPDKTFKEWEFNRILGQLIIQMLCKQGIDARPTTRPEENHKYISLTERANRANMFIPEYGKENVLFISIHSNAAGSGTQWMNARGWSVYVSTKCSNKSKQLAECLFDAAAAQGFSMRQPKPDQKYWMEDFTVLTKTHGPAVLTESLFYDNRADLDILQSEEGVRKLAEAHVEGILNYLKLNENN